MPAVLLKKPQAIVMDVTGTLVTKSFMTYSQESKQYMMDNYKEYVAENWNRTALKLCVNFLRQDVDNGNSKAPPIAGVMAPPKDQIDSLIDHLTYRFENEWNKKSAAMGIFHLSISDWGYKKGIVKTPVYDEVKTVLTRWKTQDSIKLFVNVGSANFLRNVFSKTSQGNLLPLIDGHMNLIEGRVKNFGRLLMLLEMKASNLIYLTRFPADARLAASEGIKPIIIVREDFAPRIYRIISEQNRDSIIEISSIEDRRELRSRRKRPKTYPTSTELSPTEAISSIEGLESTSTELRSNLESVHSAFDPEYSATSFSRVASADIREFNFIVSLDSIKWRE